MNHYIIDKSKNRMAKSADGYIKGGVGYYFLCDPQGSVRQVIRGTDGAVVQKSHYYPYGALFGESSATALLSRNGASASAYKYGAKELVSVSDCSFLDFPARAYDYQLGRFWTPDPLQEKKPHVSSYLYCLANPINFIDPTGLDEFEIDQDGHLKNRIKAGGNDRFYIVGNDGKRTGAEYHLDGNIKRYKTYTRKGGTFNVIELNGDAQGTGLFEWLAQNTSVEWSHFMAGLSGEKGKNFLSTSNLFDAEHGFKHLWENQSLRTYNVIILT